MRKIYTLLFFGIALAAVSCKKADPQPDFLTREVSDIDRFLAGDVNFIYYHSSGIRLQVYQFGIGIPAHAGQNINYNYTCTRLGETAVIDSGIVSKDQAAVSPIGLKLGLAYLPAGSVYNVYIPSQYGYGTAGTSNIPGNTTLVYRVKINAVTLSAAEQTQLQADTISIRKYLNDNNITQFTVAPNGIFYHIDTLADNIKPNILQKTNFAYTGILMSTGKTFSTGSTSEQITNYIDGLKFGLPLLAPGGSKATFYIPSVYAYGASGTGGVPANSNLIFKVTLP